MGLMELKKKERKVKMKEERKRYSFSPLSLSNGNKRKAREKRLRLCMVTNFNVLGSAEVMFFDFMGMKTLILFIMYEVSIN